MSATKKALKSKPSQEVQLKPEKSCSSGSMTKQHKELCCCPETPAKQKATKTPKTKIVAHIDCGFTNNLFIRGEGVSTLSWDKGIQMKNIGPNEWVWESDRPFSTMQFKVLVNDSWYEQGNNHTVAFGQEMDFTPQF